MCSITARAMILDGLSAQAGPRTAVSRLGPARAICKTASRMGPPPTPEDPTASPPQRPQVLYVMGAGRSGSTILGVTLGNCAGVFYAGELDAWLVRSGAPLLEGAERTRFWDGVRDDVDGAAELFGREAQRALERSLSLFRVHKWPARRRIRTRYRRVAQELYRAISRASGASHVVDSSHYPLRARELQELDGVDLYLLYLMRDPQSVVASFNRNDVVQYTKSTLTTNVYLWLTNLLSMLVFLRQPRERRLFVPYEDFIADPERVVGEILKMAGSSSGPPDFTSLKTGIPLLGNRLIRSEVIALKGESSALKRRSPLTAVLQFPSSALLSRMHPRVGAARGQGGSS
jgi:hypothetical protein